MSVEPKSELGWVRPSDGAVEKAARELVGLVEHHMPQRFYRGEHAWRAAGTAMIVRMADTVESIVALMNADLPVDSLILLRALYEQVVVYCWITIDPEGHYDRWLSGARWYERRLHNDSLAYDLELLSEDELAASESAVQLPGLAQMASEVDKHWGARMIGFRPARGGREGILTLRGLYVAIYRIASRAAHAQPHALEPYSDFQSYPRRVTRPGPTTESIWWPLAIPLYAHALLICSTQLRWPDPNRVRAINDAMYRTS
jgi:hypothetical protein